jgi:hypothetical protein
MTVKSDLLAIIARNIPSANKINTTGDDAIWAFLHFLVSVAPESLLKTEFTKNKNSLNNTVQRFFNNVRNQKNYLLFKNVNKKDLFFTPDEAATLVFLRWLDMIHDKTIDISFKTFLNGSPDLNGLGGNVKDLVKKRFENITDLPPYVQRILEACVSRTGKTDNIKIIVVGQNTIPTFEDAKGKHNRNTDPSRRGGGKPLKFDFSAKSGAYESNLKMKLSEIYGFLQPTVIDVRSDIFKKELSNRNGNFVPNQITMSIDQEGEPQQLSELINKNDNVSTRWNIPAMLDPGHKMLRRFGLEQDLQVLLGTSNTRKNMTSSYVIEPFTFNFKILTSKNTNAAIPWMTLRWRINKPSQGNPRSFTMEHAVYGSSNTSLKNVTPVTKREAGSNINNISTNIKKSAKHYGDFAQILQSIVSTRESHTAILNSLKRANNNSSRKCKAMGTGDGVLVGIYGLMATVFQRNSGGIRSNLNKNVKNTSAKIALFLDVPDFRNKIYFYNQGFTRDPGTTMKNAVGGTNIARASPGFSNRSRNQEPARTSVTGNSGLGAAIARATKNNNSIASNIRKLLEKNNSAIVNVNNQAREVYNKIAKYRKGGAISKIYKSYSNLPSNDRRLNYAKKLINVKNKFDFNIWQRNLNMESSPPTPAASNASSIGERTTSNSNYVTAPQGTRNTANSGPRNNTRNTANSGPRNNTRNTANSGPRNNTRNKNLQNFINLIKSNSSINITNNSSNNRKLAAVIRARAGSRNLSTLNTNAARQILNRLTTGNPSTRMQVTNQDILILFPLPTKRLRNNNNNKTPPPKRPRL